MHTIRSIAAGLTALCALSGCASQVLSDARIADNTAPVLGVRPSDVAVSERREAFPNTYYTVRVRGASYACAINGGNALTLGLTNPPSCALQPGEAVSPPAPRRLRG